MNLLDRNITLIANWFLDNLCPPILRDCKYFMYPLMRLAYGRDARLLLDFKEKFPFMSRAELTEYYRRIVGAPINTKRKTDLNRECLAWIINHTKAESGTILDAACGRGYLLSQINPQVKCTGVDLAPPDNAPFAIQAADLSALPFADRAFDTVICTLQFINDARFPLR